jgi:hypothetical protein
MLPALLLMLLPLPLRLKDAYSETEAQEEVPCETCGEWGAGQGLVCLPCSYITHYSLCLL